MQRSWAYYSIITHLTPSVLLFLASSSRLWSRSCACVDTAACIKQCQEFKVGLTAKKTQTKTSGQSVFLLACFIFYCLAWSSYLESIKIWPLCYICGEIRTTTPSMIGWTHLSGHLLQHRVGSNCPANAQKWQVNVPACTLVPIANGVIAKVFVVGTFWSEGAVQWKTLQQ